MLISWRWRRSPLVLYVVPETSSIFVTKDRNQLTGLRGTPTTRIPTVIQAQAGPISTAASRPLKLADWTASLLKFHAFRSATPRPNGEAAYGECITRAPYMSAAESNGRAVKIILRCMCQQKEHMVNDMQTL